MTTSVILPRRKPTSSGTATSSTKTEATGETRGRSKLREQKPIADPTNAQPSSTQAPQQKSQPNVRPPLTNKSAPLKAVPLKKPGAKPSNEPVKSATISDVPIAIKRKPKPTEPEKAGE